MEAKIWNRSFYIRETDPAKLVSLFGKQLKESGFEILDFSEHHFLPQGYSAFWLLAESHFAVHTFPEEIKSYCELSSCNFEKYVSFLSAVKEIEL